MRRRGESQARVVTLADLIRGDQLVRFFCLDCGHTADLDPLALALKVGEDRPLQRVLERARCKACLARWPRIDVQAPNRVAPATDAWPKRCNGPDHR